MNLKRDDNRTTIGGGINSSDLTTILPLKIDPVTGRLLVGIDVCTDVPVPLSKSTYIDENKVNVNSAELDDGSGDTSTITVCADNQGLNVDILFE